MAQAHVFTPQSATSAEHQDSSSLPSAQKSQSQSVADEEQIQRSEEDVELELKQMQEATSLAYSVHPANSENAASAYKAGLRHIEKRTAKNPEVVLSYSENACPSFDAPHLRVLGHWFFDVQQGFLLDEVMCRIFDLKDHHIYHSPQEVVNQISTFDAARFWLNMKLRLMGDILFERITFSKGPYLGQSFIVQGSVLARDEQGHALLATGYISHESSPYSEFIPREISGDGMFVLNVKSDELICSSSFHRMLGYSADEFPKTSRAMHELMIHPDDIDVVLIQNQIITTTLYGDYYECCSRLKHRDGHYIWTIGRALVLDRDENQVATQLIGTITDIHLVQNSFDTMKLMMFNDSLTGLHNRTYFQQNAVRYDDPKFQPLSVLFVDVTGLKLTNDILDHSYGDYLIIKTCEIIRQALSEEFSARIQKAAPASAATADASTAAASTDATDKADTEADAAAASAARPQRAAENVMSRLLGESTESPDKSTESTTLRARRGRRTSSMAARHALNTVYRSDENKDKPLEQDDATAAAVAAAAAEVAAAQKAAERALQEQKNQEHLQRLHEALSASGIDIIRLAGDEFLVLVPNCPILRAQSLKKRLESVRNSINSYHEQYTAIDERPVPVCFGVGVATMGDELPEGTTLGPSVAGEQESAAAAAAAASAAAQESVLHPEEAKDNLKQVIDRADHRMQEDKERQRKKDYAYLKHYFEQKKGRPVSMRDERRFAYLSEEDRENIRTQRNISRMLF